jgi:hypothetical protein
MYNQDVERENTPPTIKPQEVERMNEMPNATHDDNIERLARESERKQIQIEKLTEELESVREQLARTLAYVAELETALNNKA